jgi:hypothetical protein
MAAMAAAVAMGAGLFAFGSTTEKHPAEKPGQKASARHEGSFTIHSSEPQQVVWGMGFELQSDSIASGNSGITDSMTSVPHDLVPGERDRLADQMLKGFRYCRLAGGLYWRGVDAEQKHLKPRWPEQLTEIKSLLDRAGVESLSFEYWSPCPFWKANGSFVHPKGQPWGNELRCFGKHYGDDPVYHGDVARFLSDFSEAVCTDIRTLQAAGLKVGFFGLQNEPFANTSYPCCTYSVVEYGKAFLAVAPAIRKLDRSIKIIADTGPAEPSYIAPVLEDPAAASLVDLLVIHAAGSDSDTVLPDVRRARRMVHQPLPIYQNEYEYLSGGATAARCLNTVQNIMNWYQLAASPTWYWIHCLKPVGNKEGSGYALGFWQPEQAAGSSDLQPGHFKWNNYNWFSVVGFLKYMPWDSTVVKMTEGQPEGDARLLAFKRPDGKLVVVVSNRSGKPFKFNIETGLPATSRVAGFRYTAEDAGPAFRGQPIGSGEGAHLVVTVPNLSWEFWVQQ